jgi:hypothetical protein
MPVGDRGTISVKINTRGYGGNEVKKRVKITTNDNIQPNLFFIIKGKVESIVEITPKVARLNGALNEILKSDVKIVPNEKYPFNIIEIIIKNREYFKAELKEENSFGKKEYLIKIENSYKKKGRYFETMILKTDSSIMPEIYITVLGNISNMEQ